MKKCILILFFIIIFIVLTGCEKQQEFYNEKDIYDFKNEIMIKFKVLQIKDVVKNTQINETNSSGNLGFFLFMGGGNYDSSSKETIVENKDYYAWVENQRGGIYFAKIPVIKSRIYQDASEGEMFIVATPLMGYEVNGYYQRMENGVSILTSKENYWEGYDFFNIHIPKDTIVQNINDVNFNIKDYILP